MDEHARKTWERFLKQTKVGGCLGVALRVGRRRRSWLNRWMIRMLPPALSAIRAVHKDRRMSPTGIQTLDDERQCVHAAPYHWTPRSRRCSSPSGGTPP